jgi:hypothetical protein
LGHQFRIFSMEHFRDFIEFTPSVRVGVRDKIRDRARVGVRVWVTSSEYLVWSISEIS